jgi:hypothetical protein
MMKIFTAQPQIESFLVHVTSRLDMKYFQNYKPTPGVIKDMPDGEHLKAIAAKDSQGLQIITKLKRSSWIT